MFPDTEDWQLNDASLIWGGVFDISNAWKPPHRSHNKGTSIDISYYSIPNEERNNFMKWLRGGPIYGKNNKIMQSANQVLYKVPGHLTHYHLEIPQ